MVEPHPDISEKREQLLGWLGEFESCAVAFSAGVDSTVVAQASYLILKDRAVAVTGTSPSLAEGELDAARALAQLIGIRHKIIPTEEFSSPDYTRNDADRCYHCKTDLYLQMDKVLDQLGVAVVLNGANADDLEDYRPGTRAATEHSVRSPLAECGFTKADVRALAAHWKLPVWDKPATPCLSSRIAYGVQVTPERLAMVDKAEQFLRSHGLGELRVRYHEGDMARIELPADSLEKVCEESFRKTLIAELKRLGFKYVTLDLEGFRSGSMNVVLPVETLKVQ